MNGSLRNAVCFALRYVIILALALLIIVTMVYSIAWIRLGQNQTISFISLVKASLPCIVVFVPLSILAFMAGYCPEGSKDRMYIRMIMSVLTLFFIFYVSHSVTYDIDVLTIDQTLRSYAENIKVVLDIRMISIILSLFPVITMIDSVLEYRQNRCALKDVAERKV